MIAIIDLGSQYTMLIARRVREIGVYSEILPPDISLKKIGNADGIILSGGPSSVYKEKPLLNPEIFNIGKPILGICLGMQTLAYILGGKVEKGHREYGNAEINLDISSPLFKNLPESFSVWMSHQDEVTHLPEGFKVIARSKNVKIAGMERKNLFGLQFHPEVVHTENGDKIFENFVIGICKVKRDWTPELFIETKIEEIKGTVGKKRVVTALSGGIDSTVTSTLLYRAIGKRLTPIFVDTGLLRKNEKKEIEKRFSYLNVHIVDASSDFLSALSGIIEPEEKRKIIGNKFIEIFEREAKKFGDVEFLAQGTLYPDRIESKSQYGPSFTIKTHHNVGGLPKKLGFKLIEPLKNLFKDEVRKVGKALGLPNEVIMRHPFPGPGLAVRIIGELTQDRIDILRNADDIFIEELKSSNLYDKIWQAFAIFLPIKTVGVMGDKRTYENVIALRAVTSLDGMTAAPFKFPYEILTKIGDRIIREVSGVNRVVYDITSKPPATIEWE